MIRNAGGVVTEDTLGRSDSASIRWAVEIAPSATHPLEPLARVALGFLVLRLEPLYRIRFTYPESWMVSLDGGWEQHLFLAEGRCEGAIRGRFRGANFPRRHGAGGPFRPDFRAVIEAEDGSVVMFEWHGYGRAHPPGRRQVVGAIFHSSDAPQYRRLNDAVCVCVGEVRTPAGPGQLEPDLVLDVAELIWEPIPD